MVNFTLLAPGVGTITSTSVCQMLFPVAKVHISKSCELQVSSVAAQVYTVSILFLQSTSQVFTDLCSKLQLKMEFADVDWEEEQVAKASSAGKK